MVLDTPRKVIEALGDIQTVADIVQCNYGTAANWNQYPACKTFPSNTYVALQRELKKRGLKAPDWLWSMRACS